MSISSEKKDEIEISNSSETKDNENNIFFILVFSEVQNLDFSKFEFL